MIGSLWCWFPGTYNFSPAPPQFHLCGQGCVSLPRWSCWCIRSSLNNTLQDCWIPLDMNFNHCLKSIWSNIQLQVLNSFPEFYVFQLVSRCRFLSRNSPPSYRCCYFHKGINVDLLVVNACWWGSRMARILLMMYWRTSFFPEQCCLPHDGSCKDKTMQTIYAQRWCKLSCLLQFSGVTS